MSLEVNKVYNADYLEVIKDIPDKFVDLIITDPPYLYEKGGNSKIFKTDTLAREKRTMKNSEFGEKEINEFLDSTKRLMEKPQWYIFCSEKQVVYYLNWCLKNNFIYNLLTYNKPVSVLNHNRFSTNLEYIIRIYNYGCPLKNIDKSEYYSKYKMVDKVQDKIHIQQKDINVIKQFIELSSNEGDVILDCFNGSGTTCVACIELNRKFIGIERDKDCFDKSCKRLKKVQLKLF